MSQFKLNFKDKKNKKTVTESESETEVDSGFDSDDELIDLLI